MDGQIFVVSVDDEQCHVDSSICPYNHVLDYATSGYMQGDRMTQPKNIFAKTVQDVPMKKCLDSLKFYKKKYNVSKRASDTSILDHYFKAKYGIFVRFRKDVRNKDGIWFEPELHRIIKAMLNKSYYQGYIKRMLEEQGKYKNELPRMR